MEFYKLMYDYTNDTQAMLLDIEEEYLGFNRYDVNKDRELGVDSIYANLVEDNIAQYDYLANNLSFLVVSSNMKNILLEHKMGKYELIPVINKKDETVIGYLVHCMNIIEALDEKKSICKRKKYIRDGKEYELLSVMKYAIDSSKIKDVDMFKLEESNIPFFISDNLKKSMENSGAKGFEFLRVKS